MDVAAALAGHAVRLARCARCPAMAGTPVAPPPVRSPVMILGQAPGPREAALGRPFAWTAGRTLFRWLAQAGMDEMAVRTRVYIAAVCRCFPGKAGSGGDRVPSPDEIATCATWLRREVRLLRPSLLIPVGRLAIAQVLPKLSLVEAVGRVHAGRLHGHACAVLPLPHPSGASTWWRRTPGDALLAQALALLADHPTWRGLADRELVSG